MFVDMKASHESFACNRSSEAVINGTYVYIYI